MFHEGQETTSFLCMPVLFGSNVNMCVFILKTSLLLKGSLP